MSVAQQAVGGAQSLEAAISPTDMELVAALRRSDEAAFGLLLEVGRSVYDVNAHAFIFLAGPHQLSNGDTAGLCAAFA